MLKRTSVFILLLFFIFGDVGFLQNAPPGFTGLDVTILIDQSGSMWGAPGQKCGQQPCATRNDKFNHRIGQTKNVIYRLAEHVENTPFVHRVSVIDFGSDAEVALSNYVIRFDPNNPGGALRDAKAVIERVVTHKDGVRGINTNTPRAMELALDEYRKMAASPPTAGRQPMMLIVTDGSPNNPPASVTALQSSVVALAGDLKKMNVSVWVVGLNDASNYWNDGDGQFWIGIVGQSHARLAETASSRIFTLVQDIVDEWVGGRSNLMTGNEYQCPPYLRQVVFNVNFGSPGASIRITNPDGVDIPLASGGPTTNPATFARFIADDPKPGIYKLVKDSTRSYTISAEEYSPDIKRLSPIRAVSHEVEARIVFQATTGQGTPIASLPAWPINASIVITPSGGTATKIPAQFIDDGKWEAKWKPPQVGTYTTRLEGIVTLQNGSSYDVFGANAKSYNDKLEVNELKPYFLKLDAPDPEDGFRVTPMTTSADVSFTLVDSKNVKVANPAGVVSDPATWLSLQLVDKSGAPLQTAAIPLKPASNGVFEASAPVKVGWTKVWGDAGQLYFRVVDQPNRIGGQNYLDSIQLPPNAESQRVGGDPMTVGPLKIRYSRLLLAPLLLLVAGLAGAGAWYSWRSVLPGLWIWWADSSRNRTVTLKIYDGDRDPEGDDANKLQIARRLQFKFDHKVSVEVDGESVLAERFRVKRRLSPDVSVVVEYSWRKDSKKQVHRTILSRPRPERLKGKAGELYMGGYLMRLDVKP